MSIRSDIIETFEAVLEQTGAQLAVDQLNDDTVLLESGLESLGFAILVANLEERLGYDPFQILEIPVYPTTFGEFVGIYESNKPD